MIKSHVSPSQVPVDILHAQKNLLDWYDKYRRVLPWRALPGHKAEPYHVWLSEIMLQQTTVQAVIPYFEKFIGRWPTIKHLAAANPDDVMQAWAGLGYYARARNLLKCASAVVQNYNGVFPTTQEDLQILPGIGPYTSAAIAAIAFGKAVTVVDGNIERVVARIFMIEEPLPGAKKAIKRDAALLFEKVQRPGDFAQGLMDLGATICTPQSPKCGICPLNSHCLALKAGIAASLPVKAEKKVRPKRQGLIFWLEKDGHLLLQRRHDVQMLGGMPGLPTTDWDKSGYAFDLPVNIGEKLKKSGTIYHTFTHFDLTLDVMTAVLDAGDILPEGNWMSVPLSDIREFGLPTVFRKAVKLKTTSPGKT